MSSDGSCVHERESQFRREALRKRFKKDLDKLMCKAFIIYGFILNTCCLKAPPPLQFAPLTEIAIGSLICRSMYAHFIFLTKF